MAYYSCVISQFEVHVVSLPIYIFSILRVCCVYQDLGFIHQSFPKLNHPSEQCIDYSMQVVDLK